MQRELLKSKIHRATVTQSDLNYAGSLTLSATLARAADLCAHELVHITNVNNGVHWVTYVIIDPDHPDTVCLNGTAARHFAPGDPVIIMAYGYYREDELASARPHLVYVDQDNQITDVVEDESPFELWGPSSSIPGVSSDQSPG